MADLIQAWASLDLVGLLLWIGCVETRRLRRDGRRR